MAEEIKRLDFANQLGIKTLDPSALSVLTTSSGSYSIIVFYDKLAASQSEPKDFKDFSTKSSTEILNKAKHISDTSIVLILKRNKAVSLPKKIDVEL